MLSASFLVFFMSSAIVSTSAFADPWVVQMNAQTSAVINASAQNVDVLNRATRMANDPSVKFAITSSHHRVDSAIRTFSDPNSSNADRRRSLNTLRQATDRLNQLLQSRNNLVRALADKSGNVTGKPEKIKITSSVHNFLNFFRSSKEPKENARITKALRLEVARAQNQVKSQATRRGTMKDLPDEGQLSGH